MDTNANKAGEPAIVAHMREESELAEAHLLAAQIPDEWFAAAGVPALDAAGDDEARVMSELHTPLEPAARARIVDHVVSAYLDPGRRAAVVPIARAAPWTSRWFLASLPLTAAAAAAVTLLIVDARAPVGELLAGEVQLAPAERGEPTGIARSLRVTGGAHVLLECRGDGRTITVVGARAERTVPVEGDAAARWLGWEALATTPGGATLQVHADLPPATWEVACQVHDTASGRLLLLDPPAVLVVE